MDGQDEQDKARPSSPQNVVIAKYQRATIVCYNEDNCPTTATGSVVYPTLLQIIVGQRKPNTAQSRTALLFYGVCHVYEICI
jgi:hypothetical protein